MLFANSTPSSHLVWGRDCWSLLLSLPAKADKEFSASLRACSQALPLYLHIMLDHETTLPLLTCPCHSTVFVATLFPQHPASADLCEAKRALRREYSASGSHPSRCTLRQQAIKECCSEVTSRIAPALRDHHVHLHATAGHETFSMSRILIATRRSRPFCEPAPV